MNKKPETASRPVIIFTFIIGIICAACFRSLTVIDKLYPHLVRPVWYFAVIGYIYFFAYRGYISKKRKRIIRKNDLIAKIECEKEISVEDRYLISYILSSLVKTKEGINYFFIFFMSILAVILDLLISK